MMVSNEQVYLLHTCLMMIILSCYNNYAVQTIRAAIVPLMKELKGQLTESISNLENHTALVLKELEGQLTESISNLENHTASVLADLQSSIDEYKNQTSSELADLNATVAILRTSLHSSTTTNSEQLTQSQHEEKDSLDLELVVSAQNHLSTQVESLLRRVETMIDHVDLKLSSLGRNFEEHKNQTASELAELHVSLTTSSEQLMQLSDKINTLDSKLTSVDAHMSKNFSSLENQVYAMINPLNSKLDSTATRMSDDLRCVKTDLSSLNESVTEQSRCLEEHKNETKSELVKLNVALDSIHTLMCDKFSFFEESNTSDLVNLDEHLQQNFTKLLNICSSCLPIHTCGDTGGWRQVVHLDMTDNHTECPEGWNMTDYSKRTCGRASEGESLYASSCDSITYPVCGGEYSQVCGRIKAYQWGWTTGFKYRSIDDTYFNGVAVMHGSPRQHIWTFVAGAAENYVIPNLGLCPCDVYFAGSVPPFVGEDYFCESGIDHPLNTSWFSFHSDDILWDGKDCHSSSTCCSLHDPPFFTKTLSTPTTDELELRMCLYQSIARMNIAVELIELYVK